MTFFILCWAIPGLATKILRRLYSVIMALFGSNSRRASADRDEYAPVADDETKRLNGSAGDYDNEGGHAGISPEIYVLQKSLRRTNLMLKIVIGLLVICLLALASINIPQSVKDLVETAKCGSRQLIKTPVPPRKY